MNRTLVNLSKGALCVGALAACLASLPAQAQVQIQISPPSWFIATNRPVYYEGRPSYWYGNQWHYRQGRTWRTYRSEPRYLRDQRSHGQSRRHDYGRDNDYSGGGPRR
jgi:hypothetical protein